MLWRYNYPDESIEDAVNMSQQASAEADMLGRDYWKKTLAESRQADNQDNPPPGLEEPEPAFVYRKLWDFVRRDDNTKLRYTFAGAAGPHMRLMREREATRTRRHFGSLMLGSIGSFQGHNKLGQWQRGIHLDAALGDQPERPRRPSTISYLPVLFVPWAPVQMRVQPKHVGAMGGTTGG